ncbi:hypothetical protein J4N43_20525 [Vibrio sp. SCSIO 43009]|nr:hypothetical protein J4N43_20525 [Vibrio sp. SCSIO 43009]
MDDKPTITDVDAITVDEDDLGTIGQIRLARFQSMATSPPHKALTEW